MCSRSIVETINVFRDIFGRLLTRVVNAFLDALLLQAREKGFGDSIVPAVASPAHTGSLRLEADPGN